MLTFAPLVFEQFTGQKVPQLSGTMAEITNSLQQLQLTLTQEKKQIEFNPSPTKEINPDPY